MELVCHNYYYLFFVFRSMTEKEKLINTLNTRIDLMKMEMERNKKDAAELETLRDTVNRLQLERDTCNILGNSVNKLGGGGTYPPPKKKTACFFFGRGAIFLFHFFIFGYMIKPMLTNEKKYILDC